MSKCCLGNEESSLGNPVKIFLPKVETVFTRVPKFSQISVYSKYKTSKRSSGLVGSSFNNHAEFFLPKILTIRAWDSNTVNKLSFKEKLFFSQINYLDTNKTVMIELPKLFDKDPTICRARSENTHKIWTFQKKTGIPSKCLSEHT